MPSDTPCPRRMPWEEFEERVLRFFRTALGLRGATAGDGLREEARLLFGYKSGDALMLVDNPPAICPRCGREHQGWDALCYPCTEEAKKAAERAAAHAGILALLPPELAEKVRAELAQKGSTT